MRVHRIFSAGIAFLFFCGSPSTIAQESGGDPYVFFYVHGITKEQYKSFGLHKLSFDEASTLSAWLTETFGKTFHCASGRDRNKLALYVVFAEDSYPVIESGVMARLRSMPDVEVVSSPDYADFAVTVAIRELEASLGERVKKVMGYFSFLVGWKQCHSAQRFGESERKQEFQRLIGPGMPTLILSSEQTEQDTARMAATIDTTWLEPERKRRAEIRRQSEEYKRKVPEGKN